MVRQRHRQRRGGGGFANPSRARHDDNPSADQVKQAISDGYKRLLKPSMETEVRLFTKKKADEEAIRVFSENARQLLLGAPLGQKRTMAIDPGFRTGCKVVCLDEQGKLLEYTAIFPHTGAGQAKEAEKTTKHLFEKYNIEAIAIGNGTSGRETEVFVRNLNLPGAAIVMVNESGASIYSASEVARGAGIAVSTLSAILNGKRKLNLDHIARLARYFGLEQAFFVD